MHLNSLLPEESKACHHALVFERKAPAYPVRVIEPLSEAEIVELRRTRDLYQMFKQQRKFDAEPIGLGAVQVPDDTGESPHTNLGWALHYAALGIKVFPCNPRNKIPLVPCDKNDKGEKIPGTGWKKKATCDPEIIRAWWRKYPRSMIGAACGEASGFWAIDPDIPKQDDKGNWSPDGVAAWRKLLAEHGPHASTIEVTTASGGRHIYFKKYDPTHPLGNSEGELSKLGINVRAAGGLVILAGSQRSDGKEYVANKPFDHAALADAPEWLYAAIGKRQSTKEKVNVEFGDDLPRVDVASLNLRKIWRNGSAVRKLIVQGPMPGDNFNGDRSKALFFVLCQLCLAEVPPDTMLSIILDPKNSISDHCYYEKDGRPKESPDDVAKRQIERAIAATADEVGLEAGIKAMQTPDNSRDFLDALLSEATARPYVEGVPPNADGRPPIADGEDTSAKADEPRKLRMEDFIKDGGPGYTYKNEQERANGARGAAGPKRSRLKTLKEFIAEHVPLNYVLDPVIDAGSLYSVCAKTGSGKTAFLLLLAIAIAFNRRDLFRNEIDAGRVAYLTCENPRNFRMRLMAAIGELGISVDEGEEKLLIQDWFGTPGDMLDLLKVHEADGDFKLIIIDTLASFFTGDNSNDNAQIMAFLRGVRALCDLAGNPTVVIATHPVKNASDDNLLPYGGGAIINEIDANLTMQKVSATRTTMHWQGKIRGIEFDPLSFELREITCDAVRDKKGNLLKMPFLECCDPESAGATEQAEGDRKITILMEIAKTDGVYQSDLCKNLGIHQGTISKWLKGFEAKHWIIKTARGTWRITDKGKQEIDREKRGDIGDLNRAVK